MYIRKCPGCNKELMTNNKYYHEKALQENIKCIKCSRLGKKFTTAHKESLKKNHADFIGYKNPFYGKKHKLESKEKMKMANLGKDRFSKEYKQMLSEKMRESGNNFYGKLHSLETKQNLKGEKTYEHKKKISLALKGRPSLNKNKTMTNETRRKMRISAINRMKRTFGNVFHGNVNLKESKYFLQLEKEMNWDGIYYEKYSTQYYIEYLGYWVDYYEPHLNIVVEYDETNHYNSDWSLKSKDLDRQKNIKDYLGCKFYRYNEILNELREF